MHLDLQVPSAAPAFSFFLSGDWLLILHCDAVVVWLCPRRMKAAHQMHFMIIVIGFHLHCLKLWQMTWTIAHIITFIVTGKGSSLVIRHKGKIRHLTTFLSAAAMMKESFPSAAEQTIFIHLALLIQSARSAGRYYVTKSTLTIRTVEDHVEIK